MPSLHQCAAARNRRSRSAVPTATAAPSPTQNKPSRVPAIACPRGIMGRIIFVKESAMPSATRRILVFLISLFFLGAQEPPPIPIELPTGGDTGAASRMPFGSSSQQPQAYSKVITKDAKSKPGVFTVHEVKDKYYYEIPKTELNREFLFVTQIARTTLGVGYGGQFLSERVVRWERNANKINLREVNYDVVADPKTPISLAVKAANNDAIILTFPIAAFGKDPKAPKAET